MIVMIQAVHKVSKTNFSKALGYSLRTFPVCRELTLEQVVCGCHDPLGTSPSQHCQFHQIGFKSCVQLQLQHPNSLVRLGNCNPMPTDGRLSSNIGLHYKPSCKLVPKNCL